MAYGLKYQTQFDSVSDDNNPVRRYTLQFLFKDYTGGATSMDGSSVSVVQKCTIDDPFAPIKGQSLDIRLINDGNVPITAFQTEDDDGVQVKLLDENDNIKFIGFLVQDDFYELMVDYSHEITLSANDGLGLLKGVILSEAEVRRGFAATYRTNGVNTVVYFRVTNGAFYPQAGNTIEIGGTSYIIDTAVNEDTTIAPALLPYNWTVTLTTATPGISATVGTVYLTGEINLLNRNSLLSIIAICLAQTNLSLLTNIFMNLYEYRQDDTVCSFDQTMIDTQLFISGETYEDCYSVLTKIMAAFNCSLFQANGQWQIVHWYEAVPKESWSYANNAIPAFVYDETWTAAGTTVFNNNFFIGPDPQLTQPLFGLTQGCFRGYKFVRKVFDYKTPKYLLKNYDLLDIGALIRTYASGTDTISEYVAVNWTDTFGSPAVDRFIRVVYDNILLRESERYLVMRGDTFDSIRALPSKNIDCHIDDRIKFSCSFRTNISNVPGSLSFAIYLTDGTNNYYLNDNGNYAPNWLGTFGFTYTYEAGGNSNQWQSMDTGVSEPMPVSGLMDIFLPQFTPAPQSSVKESHFKDMRFEYIPYVNDSTKVIGQIHKQEQDVNKKLNSDTEITIDDSPRNAIAGTLFNPTFTGLLQDRTLYWRYPLDANGWRLGELTTLEELTWRQKTRSKFDGNFTGNYQNEVISLLSVGITDFDTSKNYIFGLLNIDYKNNAFSGSLWELYDNEDAYFDPDYTLTYIYDTT